tara:strand:+ start:295 stop:1161 length:867 start_codon:yes stop_codon:yes gene_type:complete
VKTNAAKQAFTLIELLIAIAIIGILLGFALPTLSKAKMTSMRAKSIHNQKQIGTAYNAYIHDHNDNYPQVWGFAAVGGKLGSFTNTFVVPDDAPKNFNVHHVASFYGATTPPEARPLNEYLSNRHEIFHDPMDIGGTSLNVDSCYESFGNSYQPQVADDMFRVKRVLGDLKETPDTYEWKSLHLSDITNPVSKIIQGDWNWPYDRGDTWHAEKGEPGHVMLYADGHAAYYVFPPTETMMKWMSSEPYRIQESGNYKKDSRGEYVLDDARFKAEFGGKFKYIDPGFKWW